ncbi:hypothetical protein ABCR94_21085 [Streptomyces sp. 21So2-11]|uniref:hypothetical protein n=1 Tax=Streptomyces sp. 21So2-11 TaxID=3144408 RepID=UPI0032198AEA
MQVPSSSLLLALPRGRSAPQSGLAPLKCRLDPHAIRQDFRHFVVDPEFGRGKRIEFAPQRLLRGLGLLLASQRVELIDERDPRMPPQGTAGPSDLTEQAERTLVLTLPGQTPPGVDECARNLRVTGILPGPLLRLTSCGIPASPPKEASRKGS